MGLNEHWTSSDYRIALLLVIVQCVWGILRRVAAFGYHSVDLVTWKCASFGFFKNPLSSQDVALKFAVSVLFSDLETSIIRIFRKCFVFSGCYC